MNGFSVEIINSISKVNANAWSQVSQASKLGSIYHSYEWLKTLEDAASLKYKPAHIVVYKESNMVGIFPNFISKLHSAFSYMHSTVPCGGGPALLKNENQMLDLLVSTAVSYARKMNAVFHTIATRNSGYIRYGTFLASHDYVTTFKGCTFILDLTPGYKVVSAGYSSAKKRAMKSAIKNGIAVSTVEFTEKSMTVMYNLHKSRMKNKNAVYFEKDFFIQLLKNMKQSIKLHFAKKGDIVIAGLLMIIDGKNKTVDYVLGGSTEEYFNLHPNEVLFDHAIRYHCEQGMKRFDFGDTSSNFNDSIFKFKEQFGATAAPRLIWEKKTMPFVYSLYSAMRNRHYRKNKGYFSNG